MEYLLWILVALIAYSLVGPLVKIIEEDVPTETDVFLTTAVMLLVTLASILAFGTPVVSSITLSSLLYAVLGGLFLAIGVLAYFRALKFGPVSIVVPIYGLFIVMSSLIGILFFDETASFQKFLGIALAVVAIYLTSTGTSR